MAGRTGSARGSSSRMTDGASRRQLSNQHFTTPKERVSMAETTHKPVAVREIVPPPRLTILRLRHPSRDDLARLGALIGTALPTEPNQAVDGAVRVIWIGPDEWLIVGDTAPTSAIEEAA